ncbi:hypothetical protein OB920_11205 [Halobacteria archaeon HArc-gm2]|nr:hypothetical protein [Halobacteria archaeon HArc-gm2]
MATTQVALALIGTTLLGFTLLCWGTVYYVPRILNGEDHADDPHADAGRPS